MRSWAPAVLLALFTTAAALSSAPAGAQQGKAFGLGRPATLEELPAGPFRSALEALPAPARGRALGFLRGFAFGAADLPYLRVDAQGGVFYEDPEVAEAETGGGGAAPAPEALSFAETFALHSRPGASRVVYLDMDGAVVTGTIWNGSADPLFMRPYDSNGNDSEFTQTELNAIAETWKRVAEDFAPYDIDVTTEEPPAFGPNVGHILVTRKLDQNNHPIYSCNCGGVAYVNHWGDSSFPYYQPALVFLDGVGTSPHTISEAGSHELGHNIGLSHDATSTANYYAGHGSGYTSWAPIMGVGYYSQVTQWSKGEYLDATNQQDDLAIIAANLSYRPDDHEDTNFALATPLSVSAGTVVEATDPVSDPDNLNPANKGVIEDRSDVDLFYVDVGAGVLDLTVTPAWVEAYYSQSNRGMNLDVRATLYDEFGVQVAQSNPVNDTYARITTSLAVGRYVLAVEGVGVGDPLTSGYSDYASLGQYFINGTVPAAALATLPPQAPGDLVAAPNGEGNILLTWSDPLPTAAHDDEDGYRVFRALDPAGFVQVATLPRGSDSFPDNNLASGSYRYYVEVYNAVGTDTSNVTAPVVVSLPVTAHATSESTSQGSVQSGSYLDTWTAAGSEVLSEQHQGGKPQNRISQLVHDWTVTGVAPAATVTLRVNAEAPANDEGDDFTFEYAIDGGAYNALGTVLNGTPAQNLTAALQLIATSTVTVRVMDTDRTAGNGDRDTVEVHLIEVTSAGQPGDTAPEVTIAAPADGTTVSAGDSVFFQGTADDVEDGNIAVDLTWNSSLDGTIGNGGSFSTTSLSVGSHTVTASLEDSAGNPGSDSIQVTVNPDNPGNTPPVVVITAPDSGATYPQGTGGFVATADDAEEGDLAGQLSWSSDLDGVFGSGASVSSASLSVGTHLITASVTDAGGLAGSYQITVHITAAINPTVAAIDPNPISRGATTPVTITGGGFEAGATVSVENGSGPAPEVSNVDVTDSGTITADVYVKTGGPPRSNTWDVRVTNPGGATGVLSGGLTVTP